MNNKPYNCLAITGGIGSGKSTALNYFKEHGFLTFSADDLVDELYKGMSYYSPEIFYKIDQEFNTNFHSLGFVNKDVLKVIISTIPNGLEVIANIMSPYINRAISETFNKHKNTNKVIFEIPLLVEQHQHVNFEKTLVIYADLDVKIERVLKRNPNLSKEDIIKRINSQLSDEAKISVADYTINNSKDLSFLYKQLDDIIPSIKSIY